MSSGEKLRILKQFFEGNGKGGQGLKKPTIRKWNTHAGWDPAQGRKGGFKEVLNGEKPFQRGSATGTKSVPAHQNFRPKESRSFEKVLS